MRRDEFMTELASLLQDISAEERIEAMQYYNDYFEDADEEEEESIVEKLGSPEKVAAEVKAGLKGQAEDTAEYRETGYTDTRFEHQDPPAERGYEGYGRTAGGEKSGWSAEEEKKPWTSKPLKIALIVLIVLAAIPILGPLAVGLVAATVGIILAVVCAVGGIFAALLIGAAAIAFAGFIVFICGLVAFIQSIPVGFLVTGTGLIMTALGVVATVIAVRICIIVFPAVIRAIVNLGRKIFRRRKAVE